MTPSEKKARECIDAGDKCPCIKADYPCEEHQMEAIVLALSEAERRGFERAKRMACKKAEDFDAYKRPCLDKAHDSRFCGYCEGKDAGVDDFREDLENLKYEEA